MLLLQKLFYFGINLNPIEMNSPDNKKQNAYNTATNTSAQTTPQENLLHRIEEVLKKHNHQFGHLH